MADPFRDRRFSGPEARRILRRAVDIAERTPQDPEWSVAQGELERAASDLGLSGDVVARAIAGPDAGPRAVPREGTSRLLGAPTRLLLEKEVAGEPSESDREDLIEDIREALGDTGEIERVGKTMTWKMAPVYGRSGREVSVKLRSRDGRTRIVIDERLTRQATGLFAGLGLGGGLGPIGGYIAAIAKLGALGVMFPLLWIPVMLLLARTIYGGLVARRERTLHPLMARLEERSRHWTGPDAQAPLRVPRAAEGVRVAPEGDEPEADVADDIRHNPGARGRAP